jgi:predicted permease
MGAQNQGKLIKVEVEVEVTLQLTVSQSVCQGIEPTLGFVTRFYFLSEGCFLQVAVLSLWGALSDERSGLSFVFLCLVIYHYLHQTFTLHVFYNSAVYIQ